MDAQNDWVTVYRSAETDAEEEAAAVVGRLAEDGIEAIVAGDDTPGVVEGSCEVRVKPQNSARAESIVAELAKPEVMRVGDNSHALDLVPIFESQGVEGEGEAMAVKSLMDANGIPAYLSGTAQIPSLAFLVLVPRSLKEDAQQALAEAEAAGPEAAEEAEAESETPSA
jgi:hypothetical protein